MTGPLEALEWAGTLAPGARPPNFHLSVRTLRGRRAVVFPRLTSPRGPDQHRAAQPRGDRIRRRLLRARRGHAHAGPGRRAAEQEVSRPSGRQRQREERHPAAQERQSEQVIWCAWAACTHARPCVLCDRFGHAPRQFPCVRECCAHMVR